MKMVTTVNKGSFKVKDVAKTDQRCFTTGIGQILKILNVTKVKLLLISLITFHGAYAISLGDTVNNSTIKASTTTTETMKIVSKDATHSEYVLKSATGEKNIFVNKNSQVYGFNWSEKNPNVNGMLGNQSKYQKEFAKALETNKFVHRGLAIDTNNLHITQFGLPGGVMEGEMVAKDLAPAK